MRNSLSKRALTLDLWLGGWNKLGGGWKIVNIYISMSNFHTCLHTLFVYLVNSLSSLILFFRLLAFWYAVSIFFEGRSEFKKIKFNFTHEIQGVRKKFKNKQSGRFAVLKSRGERGRLQIYICIGRAATLPKYIKHLKLNVRGNDVNMKIIVCLVSLLP